MKTASTALIDFLNAARAAPDAPIAFADCFTFTLQSGQVLAYTNVDVPIALNGNLCRCATYVRIRAAIHDAARALER